MKNDNKTLAISASAYTLFGYGTSQFIRLLGNLVLTRLLIPEMFGTVAIANVFLLGLGLFSDIGIAPSIIRSSRAADPDFLNTAWTLQAIRGATITALSCVIAWPVSAIYNNPILLSLIPVISLNSLVRGFESTSIIELDRNLQQRKLVFIELTIQALNLTLMIVVAYLTTSIWSLVVGSLLSSVVRTVWSHALNRARPNKFAMEKSALLEIASFGKWILLSTAMMFLSTQVDRIILGKVLALGVFGVYNIALTFAELPRNVVTRLSGSVVFPLISKYSHLPREQLKEKIRRIRKWILLAAAPGLAALGCFGDYLIYFLYDRRYEAAAWMLPLLAFGMWPFVLVSTIDRSLFSINRPQYSAFGNMLKTVYMLIAIPLFHSIGGVFGAVFAVAINDISMYAIVNYGLYKERISLLKQDALFTLLLLAFTIFLLLVRALLCLGLPGTTIL